MKKKIENNTDLRSELLDVFNELISGNCDLREVRAKCATAGKILQSAALQIKYADLRGEKPDVEFLAS